VYKLEHYATHAVMFRYYNENCCVTTLIRYWSQ